MPDFYFPIFSRLAIRPARFVNERSVPTDVMPPVPGRIVVEDGEKTRI